MPRIVLSVMVTFAGIMTMLDAPPFGWLGGAFLWAVQWFLGVAIVAGNVIAAVLLRTGRFDGSQVEAVGVLSGPMVLFLWASHIAGGLGLVLPQLTGILPWLTPIAGLALAVQAFMASGFHLRAQEEALEPALFGALFGLVSLGRFHLLGINVSIPEPAIGLAILVLLIALAINLAVLLSGPRNPFRNRPRAADRY